ncbi:MAG TPA: hypothetical protein VFN21_07630, partial [Acidimicrobiales bacterium]|nr:hypothetical protein [Acidimicrobiales bacterium]
MGAHLDPEDSAEAAGLVHVDTEAAGITRIRRGRGFEYRTPTGRRLSSERHRARIDALAIPPAWDDVWICPSPKGHIQATGRDAEGRRQYRYHQRWDAERADDKFHQLAAFGSGLAAIRRSAEADLAGVPDSREGVTALVVLMLDRTLARIGGGDATHESSSRGLTTLDVSHAHVENDRVELHFEGKGGIERHLTVASPTLIGAVAACRALAGPTLFSYRSAGAMGPITAADVNERLG